MTRAVKLIHDERTMRFLAKVKNALAEYSQSFTEDVIAVDLYFRDYIGLLHINERHIRLPTTAEIFLDDVEKYHREHREKLKDQLPLGENI